jgi:Ricin-type beta-trefoil lectin domain
LEIMGEIADAKVNQALREQLTNEADDLLAQLNTISQELSNYNRLTESEQLLLMAKLDALGSAASQLEASGKSLHNEALEPVTVVAGIKIAAYRAEYSIMQDGFSRNQLAAKIIAESKETVGIVEKFEGKINSHVGANYTYDYVADERPHGLTQTERIVDAWIKFEGKLVWSAGYKCQYPFSNTSACSGWNAAKESIKKQFDHEVVNQKLIVVNRFIGIDVSQAKVRAMDSANSLAATPFHNRPVYLKGGAGGCLDSQGNYENHKELRFNFCDPGKVTQKWIIDSAGHIHSGDKSNFCLMVPNANPSNNQRVTMQPCNQNMPYRQKFSFNAGDETLRITLSPDYCLTALGDGLVTYKCDEMPSNGKFAWYKFDNLVSRGRDQCLADIEGQLGLKNCVQGATKQLWAFDSRGNIRSFGNTSLCMNQALFHLEISTCEPNGPAPIPGLAGFRRVANAGDMEVSTSVSRQCLDVSRDPSEDGTFSYGFGWTGLAACTGIAEQLWY